MPRKPPLDYEALMADLQSPSWKVRAEAAQILGRKKYKPAVEMLIHLLKNDRTETVKSRAAVALGNIGDPRAIEPILGAGCVKHAGNQLSKFGEAAVPALKARLQDKKQAFSTRAVSGQILASIGGEMAREALISAAWDDEVSVRYSVAEGLARCGPSEETFEALLLLLRDPAPMISAAAIHSLGQLRDERALRFLVQIFHGDRPFEKDFELFLAATTVLRGWSGVREKTYESLLPRLTGETAIERIAAALSLMWLRDERALEPLRAATSDLDSDVRYIAQWSLQSLEKVLSYNLPVHPLVIQMLLR